MRNAGKKGFTLVEILVSLVIIAGLAAIVFGSFKGMNESADVTTIREQARTLQDALDGWLADQSSLKKAVDTFRPASGSGLCQNLAGMLSALKPYIRIDAAAQHDFTVSGNTLVSPMMASAGAHVTLVWSASNYRNEHPRVSIYLPEE